MKNTPPLPPASAGPDATNCSTNGTDSDAYAIGATIASPITMCLAGVVGNVLALVVLQRTKTEVRRMMFYTLVAALASTDLAGILLTTPVTVAAYVNRREMPGGIGLCKFNAFIMVCFGLATPLIVCAMAVERFLAIKCTYFYSKHCTPHNGRITIVVLWAFVFFFGSLPLFGFGDYSMQYPKTWCFLNFHTTDVVFSIYAYMYAMLNLGIVVLMTICNVFVMVSLLRVRYLKQQQGRNSISNSLLHDSYDERRLHTAIKKQKQNDVEMQMIWLMCAITSVFAACWAPLMIHIVITLATHESNPVFGLTAIRLASLNQTLDPWLYILLRKAFVKKIRDAARKIVCAKSFTSAREAPECRCNQYVHVRRQLCHRNYFVGNSEPSDPALRQSCEARARSRANEFQNGARPLPDVMRTMASNKSNQLPDVTNSLSCGNPEFNSGYELSSNSDRRHSDSPEGIYVDIFRILPIVDVTSETESDDAIEASGPNETSQDLLSAGGASEMCPDEECSSSGIFSLTPSGPNDVVSDRILHSDVTPVKPVETRQNARRTKSYT